MQLRNTRINVCKVGGVRYKHIVWPLFLWQTAAFVLEIQNVSSAS